MQNLNRDGKKAANLLTCILCVHKEVIRDELMSTSWRTLRKLQIEKCSQIQQLMSTTCSLDGQRLTSYRSSAVCLRCRARCNMWGGGRWGANEENVWINAEQTPERLNKWGLVSPGVNVVLPAKKIMRKWETCARVKYFFSECFVMIWGVFFTLPKKIYTRLC